MNTKQVIVPVADLRARPEHRSERVSQALYGHLVEAIEQEQDFTLVETVDKYRGWIGSTYLANAGKPSDHMTIVTSLLAVLKIGDTDGRLLLPYGSRIVSGGGDVFYHYDGTELSLIFGRLNATDLVSLDIVMHEALSLISVPYLWGGNSSFGYDCSGFTQELFRRTGTILPRDSKDQAKFGREVSLQESIAGDLILFPGHVAIHLGNSQILHSSRLRGIVQIDSLVPDSSNYRPDLDGKMTTIRRVIE